MKTHGAVLGGLFLTSVVAVAGPPLISNAAIEARDLEGSLESTVAVWSASTGKPRWLGWHVPMIEGDQVLCCWGRGDRQQKRRACALEGSHRHFVFSSDGPRALMESENLVILLRADNGRLDDIQVYSDSCELDAGGRKVIWIAGVEPQESVVFLGALVEDGSPVGDEALMALALHRTSRAPEKLTEIARQSPDAELRGEALFWLSHTGAATAASTILQALNEDPDADVREEAIFALSMLPEGRGIPLLLEIIQDRSQSSDVREDAFFWYVQSGDDQALDLIAELLTN